MPQNIEQIKQGLIDELKQRVSDKILEQSNADLLSKLIIGAESISEAISIAQLGTTYKRTGLHYDKRLEQSSNEIRYFKKNEALSFLCDSDKPLNKLIIGENYQALQNLLIEFKGIVDVIYIDPPYGKDNMGDFAKTNYNNSLTRDNLLSMLYPRLVLAKQLLSKDGVIFCSIDDKNQAYLKCLFDEVFGENNFTGTIIWQSATDNNPRQISTEHEYILCYCKSLSTQGAWYMESVNAHKIIQKYREIKETLSSPEEIQKELRKWIKENKDDLSGVAHYNNVDEKGVYSSSSNSSNTKPGGYDFDILHPVTGKPCPKPAFGWRWPEKTFNAYRDAGEVEWGKDDTTQPHIKKRIETATEQFKSIYYEDGRAATTLLENILSAKKVFDNPKPVNLISRLISFATNSKQDAIILDFFAGSGTTGHAVLDLNLDGGKRRFILCQLNEKTDTTPNGIAYDATAPRLKKIMTGEGYDGDKDFKWARDNKPYGGNLDVYEIESVANFEAVDGKSPFDVIDETLYGLESFKSLKKKVDWVCDNFEHTQVTVENDREWFNRQEK